MMTVMLLGLGRVGIGGWMCVSVVGHYLTIYIDHLMFIWLRKTYFHIFTISLCCCKIKIHFMCVCGGRGWVCMCVWGLVCVQLVGWACIRVDGVCRCGLACMVVVNITLLLIYSGFVLNFIATMNLISI